MYGFQSWLASRGQAVALALDERSERICDHAAARFAEQYPTLMLDLPRPDAEMFQQLAFRETPRRLHRLLQVALRFQTLAVIEREYRWSWGILPRFGITLAHMHALARTYFESARVLVMFDQTDRPYFELLEMNVLQLIERSAPVDQLRVHLPQQRYYANGHANGHSNGHSNGHAVH
jgi:hypothetical protein